MVALGDNGRERDGEPFDEAEWDEGDAAAEELSLANDDEPLPWLESDDYEDEDEGSGLGRLLLTFVVGLAAIGAILYGLWYWSNRPDPELVADGSTISAPPGPLKERPEDPGGKTFEGTGDVAPAVGEGETREGRLATNDGTAAQGNSAGQGSTEGATQAPRPSINAAGSRAADESAGGGVGVQVGAYSSRDSAERGWSQLNRQTDALQGVRYRIMEGQIDSGKVFRLQAVAGDAAAASALCGRLKSQGIPCQVKN
ncbi:MAG: SPOR domain-containing protein [Sphingomonadaceae bacterium]